jgi:FkbM family methyltransferase
MDKKTRKNSKISRLIEFIRDYRIKISPKKRLRGVGDTLVGWGLIAISTVFTPPPLEIMSSAISFILSFGAGALFLLFYVIFKNTFNGNPLAGIKDLLIKDSTEVHMDAVHLAATQRRKWIYVRGFIATGGYIAYNISRIYFGVIDNSAIFGADALVYALLAFWILGMVLNSRKVLGLITASAGVFFVVFFDIQEFNWRDGIISASAGSISALCMTVIFFITAIIVRHDNPKRVAFHQCIAGLILSLLAFLLIWLFEASANNIVFSDLSVALVKSSVISGILYAIALVFFLRAFLCTEPIVIAVVGYSLGIFVILLQWLFKGELISEKDGISAFLIGLGCFFLIREEYVEDKKRANEIKTQKPIYEIGLSEELASLKNNYISGDLDKYSYLSEKHEFNKLLLEYSSQIKNSIIESIKILPEGLIFTFKSPLCIELETDGGARSAPFEILNFGSYEIEDETMAYNLIQNGDIIFDIGAHIGWYTINFAKRFPKSHIYAFEPMGITFEFLKNNIDRNHIKNAILLNFGCSNKKEEKNLYYFKGGSALSSIENLINHKTAKKIKCLLKPVDEIVEELKVPSVDFIKCDAEGSEFFILQGARRTIKKFNPIIFIELYEEWCQKCGYSTKDVLDMLNSEGYIAFQAINGRLEKASSNKLENSERYNYFFLHQNKHSAIISNLHKKIV